jgi:hypothetical protein
MRAKPPCGASGVLMVWSRICRGILRSATMRSLPKSSPILSGFLFESSRAGNRAQRGREEPDTGSGPHATRLAKKKGPLRHDDHDCKRNGTATLFAALDTLDGRVISMCRDRHPPSGMAAFSTYCRQANTEAQQVHLIVDNNATPQTSAGEEALAATPSTFPCALYGYRLLVAEHGRALLSRPDRKPAAPRRLPQRRGTFRIDRRVHRSPQPPAQNPFRRPLDGWCTAADLDPVCTLLRGPIQAAFKRCHSKNQMV